jgi:hypothetical protein
MSVSYTKTEIVTYLRNFSNSTVRFKRIILDHVDLSDVDLSRLHASIINLLLVLGKRKLRQAGRQHTTQQCPMNQVAREASWNHTLHK